MNVQTIIFLFANFVPGSALLAPFPVEKLAKKKDLPCEIGDKFRA